MGSRSGAKKKLEVGLRNLKKWSAEKGGLDERRHMPVLPFM